MSEEIKMPQMGESIAEGTIVRWLKQVGDQVKRDEPLFEISTDKVDAEIPSPASGVLSEIKVNEGETVAVNTVVAIINGGAPKAAGTPAPAPEAKPEAEPTETKRPLPKEPQPAKSAPSEQARTEEEKRAPAPEQSKAAPPAVSETRPAAPPRQTEEVPSDEG